MLKSATVLLLISCATCLAEDPRMTIRLRESWSAYFGGVEKTVHADVTSQKAVEARVAWTFSVEDRVVARKEQSLALDPLRPATVECPLNIPEVKTGVVMPMALAVTVSEEGKDKPEAAVKHTLWVYSQDPFENHRNWLEKLDIALFDPENTTAAILKAANVYFRAVDNADAIALEKAGLVLIGEGVSFRDYRGLPALMVALAAAGVPVLCLAPKGGGFPLPGALGSGFPAPSAIRFGQNDIITELDKRLDSVAWPPDGRIVGHKLQLQGDRSGVNIAVTEENAGWPWVEIRFGRGALTICGFPVIEKWEDGPTPRYLLVRILEEVGKTTEP